jgi:hypothetical protein
MALAFADLPHELLVTIFRYAGNHGVLGLVSREWQLIHTDAKRPGMHERVSPRPTFPETIGGSYDLAINYYHTGSCKKSKASRALAAIVHGRQDVPECAEHVVEKHFLQTCFHPSALAGRQVPDGTLRQVLSFYFNTSCNEDADGVAALLDLPLRTFVPHAPNEQARNFIEGSVGGSYSMMRVAPPILLFLLQIAIVTGRLDVLKRRRAIGLTDEHMPEPMALAVMHGQLHIVKWLRERLFETDPRVMLFAAQSGSIEMVKCLHRRTKFLHGGDVLHGYPLAVSACTGAAEYGYLHILRWLRKHGCPWDSSTPSYAAKNGHIEVLQYALDNGCEIGPDIYIAATTHGHLHVLQCAIAHNIRHNKWTVRPGQPNFFIGPTRPSLCSEAVAGGHMHILQWAYDQGFSMWHEMAVDKAAQKGYLDILIWLHTHGGPPLTKQACVHAAARGDLPMLKWLHAHGCPWTRRACTFAVSNGRLETLKWLRAEGCPWDVHGIYWYAYHEEIRVWLKDNGATIDGVCKHLNIDGTYERHWHGAKCPCSDNTK